MGIIPAYAGSTLDVQDRLTSWRDHPRIRGEHLGLAARRVEAGGSSPHTRGAPGCGLVQVAGEGIIPAYAGSTSCSSAGVR